MDDNKILYSFCELLIVFEFTNRVMLTVESIVVELHKLNVYGTHAIFIPPTTPPRD